MKYFTKEWHGGGWNGFQLEQTRDAYFRRLQAIRVEFPQDVAMLATDVDLQSGLIKKVRYANRRPRSLKLSLRCGGIFQGYEDIDLAYEDVHISDADLTSLELLSDIEQIEIIADEVDFGPPGEFVHRMLFSDYDDVEIGFRNVSFSKSRTGHRSFEKDPVPFAIVPNFGS